MTAPSTISIGASCEITPMITVIAGTNRPGSATLKVAAEIKAIYTRLKAPVRILPLVNLPPGIFSPESYAQTPPEFEVWREAIVRATGLVVVTPEYNGSMPGALKYFIDLLPCPESFERKPVCFVGLADGPWGALRPVEQLQQIFIYRQALIYPERVFLPNVSQLLDSAGRIVDEEIQGRLKRQAGGFCSFCELCARSRAEPAVIGEVMD